jgi:membrane protease YdiL (CAAX protease family)
VSVTGGIREEALFRGYLQATLTRGIGFWPAAVVLSLLFGAGHLANAGETVSGVSGVMVQGSAGPEGSLLGLPAQAIGLLVFLGAAKRAGLFVKEPGCRLGTDAFPLAK